jgi:hypothetical protein
VGYKALSNNSSGQTTRRSVLSRHVYDGNDNINIANSGVARESQTMRLGKQGTAGEAVGIARTFIAEINGVTTGQAGTAVMIDSKGQLGTISSSREVKENIHPMGTPANAARATPGHVPVQAGKR